LSSGTGIITNGYFNTNLPFLTYFNLDTPIGYTSTKLSRTSSESEPTVVAKTIAKLGENGWELVSGNPVLYFKRLKE
jgi:hypothetical protein